jgi:hypothetical protein
MMRWGESAGGGGRGVGVGSSPTYFGRGGGGDARPKKGGAPFTAPPPGAASDGRPFTCLVRVWFIVCAHEARCSSAVRVSTVRIINNNKKKKKPTDVPRSDPPLAKCSHKSCPVPHIHTRLTTLIDLPCPNPFTTPQVRPRTPQARQRVDHGLKPEATDDTRAISSGGRVSTCYGHSAPQPAMAQQQAFFGDDFGQKVCVCVCMG